MPVLCECISVIIKCSSIERFFKGGMDAFYKIIPNETACSDGELFGVGFMNPMDVQSFIETLENGGLQFIQTNKLTIKRLEKGGLQIEETEGPSPELSKKRTQTDIVVVDQFMGPTTDCDWIEFSQFPVGENNTMVSACWLFEGTRFGLGPQISEDQLNNLAVPHGWTPDQTESISFHPDYESDRFTFLRHENGLDVYLEKATGKEHYTTERNQRPKKLH